MKRAVHSRYNSYTPAAPRHPATCLWLKSEKNCNFQGYTEGNLCFCLSLVAGKSFATSGNYKSSNDIH